ncbi:MAG: MBL fold metallo-hydrolase [Aquihabitans sp.]
MSTLVNLPPLPENVVIRQLYLGCLSQASYLVGDATTGRAIAVDPRRDIDEMLTVAADAGLTIELIVETHFHADFLSGHLELAEATGAEIGLGAAGTTEFPSRALADGEIIDLGGVTVEVLATPGHTPESVSLVVRPSAGAEPLAVLTGDALFIGDVGRPDLLVSANIPAEEMGALLFKSVHRLMELPDDTMLLPAHGAGSACGKSLSTDTVSTIGAQRLTNYAVQPMTEQAFIDIVTEGQVEPPAYFGTDAALNRMERPLFHEEVPTNVLDLEAFDAAVADGAAILDTRSVETFALGHLRGSINICLTGRFAEQAGSLIAMDRPAVLVGDAAGVAEATLRLGRIGFDNVIGALLDPEGVIATQPERADRLSRLTAAEFTTRRAELGDQLQVIDVRNAGEVADAPLDGTVNIPLTRLVDNLDTLDRNSPVAIVCAGGARSGIANSVLKGFGFTDVSDVLGGTSALGIDAACTLGDPA